MPQIGILYSQTTGIVLRSINPDTDTHLDWLDQNKPQGTLLLRIDKSLVGADDQHMPNLDVLIPYAEQVHGISLSFGKPCPIVDETNTVVDVVFACPDLYEKKLQKEASKNKILKDKVANIGDTYDKNTNSIIPKVVN